MGGRMRLYDWEARLAAYVAEVAREGFSFGQHDCALFGAGAANAVTGIDPAKDWRGQYDSLESGLRLIRKVGFRDHIDAARRQFPEIRLVQVMAGDLAIVPSDDGPAIGVIQGSLIYALRLDGLGLVPLEAASEVLGVR